MYYKLIMHQIGEINVEKLSFGSWIAELSTCLYLAKAGDLNVKTNER